MQNLGAWPKTLLPSMVTMRASMRQRKPADRALAGILIETETSFRRGRRAEASFRLNISTQALGGRTAPSPMAQPLPPTDKNLNRNALAFIKLADSCSENFCNPT